MDEKLKRQIYACGLVFEIAGVLGLFWAILLAVLLLKFGNTKVIVSYVPLLSLCLATLGHLVLLVFHLAPQLLGADVGDTLDAVGDFLFFPFWYGLMLSLCLLAVNRVAICLRISLNNFVFNTKWMLTFVAFGWAWGCAIGVAALVTKNSFLDNVAILKILNRAEADENQRNATATASTTEKKRPVGYVLIVTQTLDSLTVISLLVCYSVVIYHVTKGRRILRAQNSVLLMSIANTIGVVLPEAPANRPNRIFPFSTKRSGVDAPTSVAPPAPGASYFQQAVATASSNQHHGFWSITWHFCLMSSSAACCGVFIFVSKFFITPQILLAQYGVYLMSTLTNVYLLSTVNTKIKDMQIRTFKYCFKCGPWTSTERLT